MGDPPSQILVGSIGMYCGEEGFRIERLGRNENDCLFTFKFQKASLGWTGNWNRTGIHVEVPYAGRGFIPV